MSFSSAWGALSSFVSVHVCALLYVCMCVCESADGWLEIPILTEVNRRLCSICCLSKRGTLRNLWPSRSRGTVARFAGRHQLSKGVRTQCCCCCCCFQPPLQLPDFAYRAWCKIAAWRRPDAASLFSPAGEPCSSQSSFKVRVQCYAAVTLNRIRCLVRSKSTQLDPLLPIKHGRWCDAEGPKWNCVASRRLKMKASKKQQKHILIKQDGWRVLVRRKNIYHSICW